MPYATAVNALSPVAVQRASHTGPGQVERSRSGALPWRGVRALDALFVLACSGVIAVSALQVLLFSFGRDQSIYAVVAEALRAGGAPYRDVWDFKPPGVFLTYALAFELFGSNMVAPRLIEVGCLLASSALLLSLGRTFFSSARAGWLAAAIAAWLHAQLEFWHTGQPESYAGVLGLLALWLTERARVSTQRIPLTLAVGFVAGVASLFKPPLGGVGLVCAAHLSRSVALQQRGWGWLQPLAQVALGGLVPLGAVALWLWSVGALPAAVWTLFEYTPGYTRLSWTDHGALGAFYHAVVLGVTRFSALIAIGVLLVIGFSSRDGRARQGVLLTLGVLAVHFAGIAMQGKFFEYHFGATFPLLALLAGFGWERLGVWLRPMGRWAGPSFCAALLFAAAARQAVKDVPHGYWGRLGPRVQHLLGREPWASREVLDEHLDLAGDFNLAADRKVARRVRELLGPSVPLYVWGFEPLIYWLSERPAATRYVYNVAQRSAWARERVRAELMTDLERARPGVIVVQHHDYFSFVTGDDLDSARALQGFPELNALLERDYEKRERIEDFDLYTRRDP